MARSRGTAGSLLIRCGGFAFTVRTLRNAIDRDRQSLAVSGIGRRLPCGVRELARIERWLDDAARAGQPVADVPIGPSAGQFGAAVWRWFNRLVGEGRYCQARCRTCSRDYRKAELVRRSWGRPGIRIRSGRPTGAWREVWRCCPKGHKLCQLSFRIS
jgi:hypothetical protein